MISLRRTGKKATLVKVANAYASLAILLNMAEQANVKKRV